MEEKKKPCRRALPFWLPGASFALVELFGFLFLGLGDAPLAPGDLWPLAFGAAWALMLGGLLGLLPRKAARIVYGIVYLLALVYAGVETGYFILFDEMMWISEFLYAAEGSDYASTLLTYPALWWCSLLALIALGVMNVLWFPRWELKAMNRVISGVTALACLAVVWFMPRLVFLSDRQIRYAGSDYGRMQSAEAAYENMFSVHRLYQVCGLYQTAVKDIYFHQIYPSTPAYAKLQKEARSEIQSYFDSRGESENNAMTGLLEGKNVVLVLMESMDDWMIGEHTPTLRQLMDEGICFTSFYTPCYGSIRTFNTEFCANTGSFLSSQGGYAFDYVTNTYSQSLAAQLTRQGYSAQVFHYNDPSFYSRGVYSLAMGYERYVCYADYIQALGEEEREQRLYDDQLLFDEETLAADFFRDEEKTLNFIITRSAHLSYKYNEVLSYWGLKKYPQYRGLTGNEETDCALLKARLVDDLFARLLEELEKAGQLEDTVIIGVTDHYTYGYKDMDSLLELSGTEQELLLEKTPCFIWSPSLEPMTVDKTLNTSDLLPTVLNLMGVETDINYLGQDAFDARYDGFVPFADGSWITGNVMYDSGTGETLDLEGNPISVSEEFRREMDSRVEAFITVNNLILETNYYAR